MKTSPTAHTLSFDAILHHHHNRVIACAAIPDGLLQAIQARLWLALETAMSCDEAKTALQPLFAKIPANRRA